MSVSPDSHYSTKPLVSGGLRLKSPLVPLFQRGKTESLPLVKGDKERDFQEGKGEEGRVPLLDAKIR
jgi:hypothetical protein